jgi:hypothetical protein
VKHHLKFKQKIFPVYIVKAYRGEEILPHPFLISAVGGGKW